jgi:hypothetical protein
MNYPFPPKYPIFAPTNEDHIVGDRLTNIFFKLLHFFEVPLYRRGILGEANHSCR